MDELEWLGEQFEAHRTHLRAVAYRMLGSRSEADDAVQEAWLRLNHSDPSDIQNLGGWLTTVVARVCLDMLRMRKSRREEPLEPEMSELFAIDQVDTDAELETLLADSVGLAMLVVLDTLTPAERIAFVLHDLFAMSFDEIAPIVGRSPTAARQLASRARRRVQGVEIEPDSDLARQRRVVEAFLAASRGGDFEALLAVLDPDVVVRSDRVSTSPGAPREVRSALAVAGQARFYSRRARFGQLALVNGTVGGVLSLHGRLVLACTFKVRDDKIVEIEFIADPARLRQLDLAVLDG